MADERSRIDTDQVVAYLNRTFSKALSLASRRLKSRDNSKGSPLYEYQVDFCYLIDDIQRGASYIVPKKITEANELISKLELLVPEKG